MCFFASFGDIELFSVIINGNELLYNTASYLIVGN